MIKDSVRFGLSFLKDKVGQECAFDVIVLRTIYFNDSNSYGVYEVAIEDEYINSNNIFSIVGTFELEPDKTYTVKGEVEYNAKYGYQMSNPDVMLKLPKYKESIKRLLANLHGVGPAKATLLVTLYGDKALEQIMNDPDDIIKRCQGIGKKTLAKASKHLRQEQEKFEAILNLSKAGLSPKLANDVLGQKGWKKTYDTIVSNPYQLLSMGLPFTKVDEIAGQLKVKPNNINRLKAGITYALNLDAVSNGDCYVYDYELFDFAKEILNIFCPIPVEEHCKFANSNVEITYFGITKNFKYSVYQQYKQAYPYKKNLITGRYYQRSVFTMYQLSEDDFENTINELVKEKTIVVDGNTVALKAYSDAEDYIATTLTKIKNNKVERFTRKEAQDALDKITSKNNITLSKDQNEAIISMAISDGGTHLLIGSAGCGKTFSMNLFIKLYKELRKLRGKIDSDIVTILAPTGRASKVISNATNIPAQTIHRGCGLGGIKEENGNYVPQRKIDSEIIIVDESSMPDVRLVYAFLQSVSITSKIIFSGDIKQLAPIGAGKVLYDIIQSQAIDIFTLSTIQRQKEGSGIIYNADKIVNCEEIEDKNDCKVIYSSSDKQILLEILKDFRANITNNSIEDIQIISPMKNYSNGVNYINYEIQKLYNPIRKEDEPKKHILNFKENEQIYSLYMHKGDKVINIKNDDNVIFFKKVTNADGTTFKANGKKGLANGDIGVVTDIRKVFSEEFFQRIEVVIVKFDDGFAMFYEKSSDMYGSLSNLNLAYAITIHKSQGSQWKHVTVVCGPQHAKMITNNLLYTAITRAQESATIICDKNSIDKGMMQFANLNRKTKLVEKLQDLNN